MSEEGTTEEGFTEEGITEASTVSVVIPTYYRNDRLREAIESARAQAWPVEVIVVDGSGEAHARPVAEEFAERDGDRGRDRSRALTYVAQEEDEGPHVARSVGAGHANGEYVQFLDDDDRLLPGKFEAQVPLFGEDVGVVYSGLLDEEWGVCEPRPDVRGDVLAQTLEMRTFPAVPSTMLIERDLVEDLRPFEHRHGADDSGMKIELARRTEFDYVEEPLVRRGKPGGDDGSDDGDASARDASGGDASGGDGGSGESLSDSWAHVEGRRYVLERYEALYEQFPDDVERTARCWTEYRAGKKRLEERPWSPLAPASFARAAYHAPEDRPAFATAAVASLFGRAGLSVADRLLAVP